MIAAAITPMAQPDCIRLMALPRCSAGQVSATSTEPAAHSPPSPNPTRTRHKISCDTLIAVAFSAVKIEYTRIETMRVRARPILSESAPNNKPPNPEAIRVTDARPPAAAPLNLNSLWMAVSANAYSITSMPSSAQPAVEANSIFHCSGVDCWYQGVLIVMLAELFGSESLPGLSRALSP